MKNYFEIEARVQADAKMQVSKNQKRYTNISLECIDDEGRKQWFSPTAWDDLAEQAGKLKKDDMVIISGNLYKKGVNDPMSQNKRYELEMSLKKITKSGEEKPEETTSSDSNEDFDFDSHLNKNNNPE